MTTSTSRQYKLISADGHFNEPGDLWTSRVRAEYQDRVPRLSSFEEGDAWTMAGVAKPRPFGWGAVAGRAPDDQREWMRFDEINAGSYDPAARVRELDMDDVDAEVLFPSSVIGWVSGTEDPSLHGEMVRAYNDFLSEFCGYAPDRFGAPALVPNRGAQQALAEIDRLEGRPGLIGYQLRCFPNGSGVLLEEDEPVWQRIAETGRPITIHVGYNCGMPPNLVAKKLPGTAHFHDAPGIILQFIFSGVLDRYPNLHVMFAEIDCGWIPYFAEQADDNFLRHAKSSLKDLKLELLPSEYIKRNFSASFITDHYAIENRHRVGIENMLWSNDYPHITSDWPYSWKTINASFAGVPAEERHMILAGNAQRIFGFGQ